MANPRLCSIPECGKPYYGLGYCKNHYRRFKFHGDPLGGTAMRGSPLAWVEANKTHDSIECLDWPFGKNRKGYGSVRYGGAVVGAHRVMCIEAHGEPPSDIHEAAHSCGNGKYGCVNPKHLRWATPQENCADTAKHGSLRGELSSKNKLTREQVRVIRSLHGTRSAKQIGIMFGVSGEAIAGIFSGKSWGWLP